MRLLLILCAITGSALIWLALTADAATVAYTIGLVNEGGTR